MSGCFFDSENNLLACSSDSIDAANINIFECGESTQVGKISHSSKVSSFVWIPKDIVEKNNKKAHKAVQRLAVGFESGLICIFDSVSGETLFSCSELSKPVSCLLFRGTKLFAATKSGEIIEWKYSTDQVKKFNTKVKNITVIQQGEDEEVLLLCNNRINVYNMATKKMKHFAEHVDLISQVIIDNTIVTCAKEDRFVYFWDSKTFSLLFSHTFDQNVASIHVSKKSLICVTVDGVLHYFKDSKKDAVTLEFESETNTHIPILSASFHTNGLLVCRGSLLVPVVELFAFPTESGKLVRKVEDLQPTHLKVSKSKKKENLLVSKYSDFQVSSVLTDSMDQVTLGEKIALSEPIDQKPSTVTSLYNMLTQGLRTGDKQLIENCFSNTNQDIIDSTVKKVSPLFILELLNQLVIRFQQRPSRGVDLLRWIKSVLAIHAGYLMTVPRLSHRLNVLYTVMENRTNVLPKLLKLSGRLELITTQASMRTVYPETNRENTLVFNDESSDEEEESESEEDESETESEMESEMEE